MWAGPSVVALIASRLLRSFWTVNTKRNSFPLNEHIRQGQEEPALLALEASTDSMHKEARYQSIEYDGWQRVEHGVGGQLSVVHLAITSEKRKDMNRSLQ